MKIRGKDSDDEPVLNLTPMIDVVFQLLVFFMVATTFLDPEKEIDIELPEATSGEAGGAEIEEIIINVSEDGTIVMGGAEVTGEQLVDTLKAAARQDPDQPVTIRGDERARHGRIVTVLDACGQAGLLNMRFSTIEES